MDQDVESDIRDKMEVATNTLKQCEIYSRGNMLVPSTQKENFILYTLKDVKNYILNETISFRQLATVKDSYLLSGILCSAEVVRLALKEFYLNKRQIPSRQDIMNYTQENNKSQKNSTSLRGFVWLKMPGMKKGIVIEDPERVFKRIEYIKKMAHAREQKKQIVYIDSCDHFVSCKEVGTASVTAVSSKTGLISVYSTNSEVSKSTETLLIDLLGAIEGKCVFVLEEEEIEELPTACSTKSVMSNWLRKKEIPHDPNAHRGELYNLINQMKDTLSYKSKTDEVITGLGHEVIRRPKHMTELDFFYRILCNIISPSSESKLKEVLESLTLNSWFDNEALLIEAENNMYNDDLQMENIIDSLIYVAKNGDLSENTPGLLTFQEWGGVYKEIIFH